MPLPGGRRAAGGGWKGGFCLAIGWRCSAPPTTAASCAGGPFNILRGEVERLTVGLGGKRPHIGALGEAALLGAHFGLGLHGVIMALEQQLPGVGVVRDFEVQRHLRLPGVLIARPPFLRGTAARIDPGGFRERGRARPGNGSISWSISAGISMDPLPHPIPGRSSSGLATPCPPCCKMCV